MKKLPHHKKKVRRNDRDYGKKKRFGLREMKGEKKRKKLKWRAKDLR